MQLPETFLPVIGFWVPKDLQHILEGRAKIFENFQFNFQVFLCLKIFIKEMHQINKYAIKGYKKYTIS